MAHKLHEMLEKIEASMNEQLNHGVDNVDTEEFGKVADLYKDLMCAKKDYWESHYYRQLVDVMEDSDSEEVMDMFDRYNDDKRYYNSRRYSNGRMYYSESSHDPRQGQSGFSRKMYMESKELHKTDSAEDKQAKMRSLENYMKDLAKDVSEMIIGATAEEKALLKQKMQALMQTI